MYGSDTVMPAGARRCRSIRAFGVTLLWLVACSSLTGCSLDTNRAPSPLDAKGEGAPALPHAGSGIIVSSQGHILTHASVVEGARRIAVEICNQDRRERASAAIIAQEPATGIVLLQTPATSRWAMRWRQGERPASATACGWPLVGLSDNGRHDREMSAATGPITGGALGFPLGPGYEGGVLADENARGVGMIGPTFRPQSLASPRRAQRDALARGGLLQRPAFIPAKVILRFLAEHGIKAPAERADYDRPWRTKLGWLQYHTVQIEREPARSMRAGMPRLIGTHRLATDDIVSLHFEPTGRLIAEGWKAPAHTSRVTIAMPEAASAGSAPPSQLRYYRDRKGSLLELDESGRTTRDLAAMNGFRGFNARGPLTVSDDGRLTLAGDALVWSVTGTVIQRLDVRADEALALSLNGLVIAHAPAHRPGTVRVWRLPEITP